MAVHDAPPTEPQNRGRDKRFSKRRDGRKGLAVKVYPVFGRDGFVLVTSPTRKKLVLTAGRFQRLDHLDPIHRGTHHFSALLQDAETCIDARALNDLNSDEVKESEEDTGQSEPGIV